MNERHQRIMPIERVPLRCCVALVFLDKFAEAEKAYLEALRIDKKLLGDEDTEVATNADKQQIGQLLLQGSKAAGEEITKRLETLEQEVQEIESKLATEVAAAGQARRALAVTTKQVTETLPPDTALIEYYWYQRYLTKDEAAPAYGAVVFLRDRDPIVVELALVRSDFLRHPDALHLRSALSASDQNSEASAGLGSGS